MSFRPPLNADLSVLPPPHSTSLALQQPYRLQTTLERQREEQSGDESLTLTDLLHIVLKHKWTLLMVMLLACAVATVRTLLSTPIYRSTAVLQIERVAPPVVRFNEMDQYQGYVDEEMSQKTQYQLLKSESLAERVIDELKLDQSKPTAAADGTDTAPGSDTTAVETGEGATSSYLERIVSGYRKLTSPNTRDTVALDRDAVIASFLGALTVEPVRSSRLVKVHVDNANPELAARIANGTVQAFITMGLERRLEGLSYAKNFLGDQIKQMKARLEESERKLNQYAQNKQILTLDEKTSVVNQTYTDYAAALARAEQERIKVESLYSEIQRNPDNVAAVVDNKTIQSYKEARAKLQIEYQQNLRIYKPDFPKMLQLKAQIVEADSQIKAEIATIAAGVQSQFDSARKQEAMIRQKLGETRKQVLSTQDSSISLSLLKREVDTNRQLYDELLKSLKQVGVSAGVATNNISVVDVAKPARFPYAPSMQRNLMIGLAAGMFLGLCLVFVLEFLDDSIKFPDEVENVLGLTLMGIIPMMKANRTDKAVALEMHDAPRSTIAEAYRSVRTALQFSTPEGAPKRLLVTSTTRNEGKSTTAVALGINFAQMGQRVLLIDADMRNPSVHKLLGIPNDSGLSNVLSSESKGEQLILPTTVPNLSVLTAGPIPPNPVDLLMGPKLLLLLNEMDALGIDYIVVDSPPLLGIADSIVLGNQLQNILFVVQGNRTRKSHIRNALRRLRRVGLLPHGVVITQTPSRGVGEDYSAYYGYYGSGPADAPEVRSALT